MYFKDFDKLNNVKKLNYSTRLNILNEFCSEDWVCYFIHRQQFDCFFK